VKGAGYADAHQNAQGCPGGFVEMLEHNLRPVFHEVIVALLHGTGPGDGRARGTCIVAWEIVAADSGSIKRGAALTGASPCAFETSTATIKANAGNDPLLILSGMTAQGFQKWISRILK
jgi:hypothetical protein